MLDKEEDELACLDRTRFIPPRSKSEVGIGFVCLHSAWTCVRDEVLSFNSVSGSYSSTSWNSDDLMEASLISLFLFVETEPS